LRKRNHLAELGEQGRIGLKWTFKKWDEVMSWTELAQDRDRWRELVNAVMYLLFL
jgi:hypothetical protein